MPIYEYICMSCREKYDELRSMSQADEESICPHCKSSDTSRLMSLFNAQSSGKIIAGGAQGCSTCQSNNCASCGQS